MLENYIIRKKYIKEIQYIPLLSINISFYRNVFHRAILFYKLKIIFFLMECQLQDIA